MTFDAFNALSYGEKIDLLGMKVMGWTSGSGHMADWNPLEKIEDAWMLTEKWCMIEIWKGPMEPWSCRFGYGLEVTAEKLPVAICISALKAVGVIV